MPEPRKPLGILRIIFAGIGIIIMILTGGCALLFGGYGQLGFALSYAALPFLVGFGIWLLAVRAGRD
jgi:hypothetical protein